MFIQATDYEFKELMTHQDQWCVSVFMPTRRAGSEPLKGPIRLKNLLREAEKRLSTKGMRPTEIQALLQDAENLLAAGVFWKQQQAGLAVFVAPGIFRNYNLPLAFDEFVMVAERFYLKPLLPLLSGEGQFHLLALSLSGFRFFSGTREEMQEIQMENVPGSLAETLQYDMVERQLQQHTVPRTGGKGERSTIFHGHGTSFPTEEEGMLRYFRAIDAAVQKYAGEDPAPLVLAGVDHIRALYQKASTYANLFPNGISGNPEMLNAQSLHQAAWELVSPTFQHAQTDALAKFNDLAQTKRTSSQLKYILPAAYHGQIDTLFLEDGQAKWGQYDTENDAVHLDPERRPGSDDLLDLCAIQTLSNGGNVFVLEPEQLENEVAAAIFRYPLEHTSAQMAS